MMQRRGKELGYYTRGVNLRTQLENIGPGVRQGWLVLPELVAIRCQPRGRCNTGKALSYVSRHQSW